MMSVLFLLYANGIGRTIIGALAFLFACWTLEERRVAKYWSRKAPLSS
jgi:hypothetical protein